MTVHASQTDIFHSKEIKEALPMWTGKMLHKIILYRNKTVLTSKSKVFNVQPYYHSKLLKLGVSKKNSPVWKILLKSLTLA